MDRKTPSGPLSRSAFILEASHTHLFPGHKGKVSGLASMAELSAGRDCLVEFSDGSAAVARIRKSDDCWQLYTNAYRTGAGTDIAERRWLVRLQEYGDNIEFHILKKAPTN